MFHKLSECRWELAFVNESIEEILSGKTIHFTKVRNPFADEFWFADPFILDVTQEYIFLLVEAMPTTTHKGVIAKLTISRSTMTITEVEIILEEPWHLSFPNIMRKDGHIYVYPESAYGKKLYLYELVQEPAGKSALKRVGILCDDVIWDTDISDLFGEQLLFTAKQDDFHLDIYKWNNSSMRFEFAESLESRSQNMRMAGAFFEYRGTIVYPSQVSTPYVYGKAVELREISHRDNKWHLKEIRTINHPKGLLYRGLHTFNTYKGLTIVDFNLYNTIIGLMIGKLVEVKKRICKTVK